MTGKDVMRAVMKEKKMTMQGIADKAGYLRATNVQGILNSDNARVDNLVRVLNACGYDLIAVDRSESGRRYVIGDEDSGAVKGAEKPETPETPETQDVRMKEMFSEFQKWYEATQKGGTPGGEGK